MRDAARSTATVTEQCGTETIRLDGEEESSRNAQVYTTFGGCHTLNSQNPNNIWIILQRSVLSECSTRSWSVRDISEKACFLTGGGCVFPPADTRHRGLF